MVAYAEGKGRSRGARLAVVMTPGKKLVYLWVLKDPEKMHASATLGSGDNVSIGIFVIH